MPSTAPTSAHTALFPATAASSLRWAGLGLVLIGAAVLAACNGKDATSATAPPPPPGVGYITIEPKAQGLHADLTGRTKASQSAEVRPQVSGILQQRLFTEGANVKAGQPLYQIDSRSLQAAVSSAEAALAKARASAQTSKANAARNAELVKIDAISRQANDESQAQAAQGQADVAVAQAALDNARINLQYSRITAPISGQIDLSTVLPGALVTANQTAALTTISQLDPILVDITQSSAELLELRRQWQAGVFGKVEGNGAKVRLILEDGSRYPHIGTLRFTGTSVSQTTGAITLRATVPNPDRVLMPGMYVRAQLATGEASDAIVIPQPALRRDPAGNPSVQVLNADNKIEKRPIKLGQALGSQWMVTEGLARGDRVMVDGFQKARIGQNVTPIEMRVEGNRVVTAQATAAGADAGKAPTQAKPAP